MLIKHSQAYTNWRTPEDILGRVEYVLGGIDLDPASSLEANKTVGAKRIMTKKQEELHGVTHNWHLDNETVFLNPPGGRDGRESVPFIWWKRLLENRSRLKSAIFLAFSIEQLQVSQHKGVHSMCEFPMCIPAKRIRFERGDSDVKISPTHANAIIYVPGLEDNTHRFAEAFSGIGSILTRFGGFQA